MAGPCFEGPPPGFPLGRVQRPQHPAATCDGIVPTVLAHVAASASVQASVVGLLVERTELVDSLALARIAREREAAMTRYLRDRDPLAFETAMARLDREGAEARSATRTVDPNATLAYLADLPRLWQETAPERHRNPAEAMFERIEVLGTREAIVHPTPEAEAHGRRAVGKRSPECRPQRSVWSGREE